MRIVMRQIYYRGSLNFCNYSCTYCPFSKKKESHSVLKRDEGEWFRFVEWMEHEASGLAVLVVPYGEALIHEYYWDGLARLSACPGIGAVGAQSNFSFPVGPMLDWYERFGGKRDKLRLWGTFHPEMTTVDAFLRQCHALSQRGIAYSVGGVGVPEYAGQYREIRDGLPADVYFWLNQMDGMGRVYTEEERAAFEALDDCFSLELRTFSADASRCGDAVFIQGDGTIRSCVLCHTKLGNLYETGLEGMSPKYCTAKACDCYLSYNNRDDIGELAAFAPMPAFRIKNGKKTVDKWNDILYDIEK